MKPDRDAFMREFGWVFENSPWVAEEAWESCQEESFGSVDAVLACMVSQVEKAGAERQLRLLREHPDLGTRARVSASSESEQAGAGLDRLSADEYERLTGLNAAYRAKFGFPFLYAVKGSDKFAILEALMRRLENTREAEFREALSQVYRIARFRLEGARG